MIASFQPADYALCALALVLTLLGLFRGFSGSLAFVAALAAASAAALFGWTFSASLTEVVWQRGAGVLVATLLVYGLVRLVVKKLVNGLLAQPSDAIFGGLLGAALAALALVGWAQSGVYLEHSTLARELAAVLRS